MYDEIAAEPLPSDLIDLIDRDTVEAGNPGKDAGEIQANSTANKDKN